MFGAQTFGEALFGSYGPQVTGTVVDTADVIVCVQPEATVIQVTADGAVVAVQPDAADVEIH